MTESTVDEVLPVAEPGRRLGRWAMLRPLAERDFRLLWIGETISLTGDQFHLIALSWLVLSLTGSGLALGSVLIAASIPRVVFMLLGGALSDRLAPRSLMLGSNVLRATVMVILTVLVLSGRIEVWHLLVFGIVFGAVDAIFLPALNTVVPMLVATDRLPAANALIQLTSQASNLFGPIAAGILVAVAGAGPAFAVDAATFALAAMCLAAIRGGRRAEPVTADPATSSPEPTPALLATIRSGAAYAFADPGIRLVIVLTTAFNLALTGPIAVGLPWLASQRFDGGSVAFGFMFTGFGAGAVIGAVLAGSLPRARRQGIAMLLVACGMGAPAALLGFAPSALVAAALLAVMGVAAAYLNVVAVAWLQARTEPAMIGRVMSLVMLGSFGLGPVSLALAGILVDANATAMFVAAGALILVVAIGGLLSGAHRRLD